jgi:aspartate aminotransferase
MAPGTLPLAERLQHVALSPTMKGTIEAERLRRLGVDLVDLGAGEPDFPTPPHVIAAAHAALDEGFTKYTANAGLADLRRAVAARYAEDHGVQYAPEEVIITAGGKQALFHAALALFGPGDEVVTHTPGWPTIVEQVKLAGASPVQVPLDQAAGFALTAGGKQALFHAALALFEPGDEVVTHTPGWPTIVEQVKLAGASPVQVPLDQAAGFALTAGRLLAGTTSRTRGLILNSPANPTGACLADQDARALAAEASRRGWWVVLDLCYDRLVYDDASHDLVRIFGEQMRDRLVICGSTSKTYAMTGWRCGWMVAPQPVVEAAGALQSHQTSNVNAIAQKAALAALTGPQECVAVMREAYRQRRDALIGWLAEEARLAAVTPSGAFYLFPTVATFLSPGGCATSQAFTDRLLHDAHVVVTPGEAFGAPGFVRLSYAASLERLHEGATRLIRFARAAH